MTRNTPPPSAPPEVIDESGDPEPPAGSPFGSDLQYPYTQEIQQTTVGRIAHVVNDVIGWRGLWLLVTGMFLMVAGVALRQTTSAFFTGQAQPVVSSFRTAVVNLQPQVLQMTISSLVPGMWTATSGSVLNGGDVPVNLFLSVVADVSSNLDADATGGLRIAGFRCRNAQSLPVPCTQASTLHPITSLVTGMPETVETNAPQSTGLPTGVMVSAEKLQFPRPAGGTSFDVSGVPVLTANNRATGCAPQSEGAACFLGSFGGNPIATPFTTVPWGVRMIDVPEVTDGIAVAIPGSLEYVVLYVYLPGTAPATMQGQSTTLSFVFAAIQAPGGVDEARPSTTP
jgi:hypothetical protein